MQASAGVATGASLDAPLLEALRQQRAAATGEVDGAVLDIRMALYRARTEQLPEAQAVPEKIRADWAGREQIEVYTWLWILEAVIGWYQTSRTGQRTRLQQAYAAASRAGLSAPAGQAAAWLAHFAYNESDYPGMLRWLQASDIGRAALVETDARSALTLAGALELAGEASAAARWFGHARELSRQLGDRAGIMAASANGVMIRLNAAWLCHSMGDPMPHDPQALRTELMSALGYERLSRSVSLVEQNGTAQLRLAVLLGQRSEALALAQRLSDPAERHTPSTARAADVLGRVLAPRIDAQTARQAFEQGLRAFDPEGLDDDDAAASWAWLARWARELGDPATSERLFEQARAARQRFERSIQSFLPGLREIEAAASAAWRHTRAP